MNNKHGLKNHRLYFGDSYVDGYCFRFHSGVKIHIDNPELAAMFRHSAIFQSIDGAYTFYDYVS